MAKTECKRNTGILLVGDIENQKLRVLKYARCKQWDCEYCAGVNVAKHRSRIIEGYNQVTGRGLEFVFMTLTMSRYSRGMEKSVASWRENWHKLRKRLARVSKKHGEPVHYVYIAEKHQDDTLHVHGLFPAYCNQKWWKDNAHNCKLGYQVKRKAIDNAGLAVWYCTKYMSKNIGVANWMKNFRRVNYSKSFPALPVRDVTGKWEKANPFEAIVELVIRGWGKGFEVELFGEKITELYDILGDDVIMTVSGLASEQTRLKQELFQLDGIYLRNKKERARRTKIKKRLTRIKAEIKELLPTLFD